MRRYSHGHHGHRSRKTSGTEKALGVVIGLVVAGSAGTGTAVTVTHHHAPRVAPVTSGSERAFIVATLADLGAPDTASDRASLASWFRREYPQWPPYAENNPMSSTLSMPGATIYNSVGVRNYPTAAEGAEATALTLKDGYYHQIVAALRSGAGLCGNPSITGELLTWSGNGYSEVC